MEPARDFAAEANRMLRERELADEREGKALDSGPSLACPVPGCGGGVVDQGDMVEPGIPPLACLWCGWEGSRADLGAVEREPPVDAGGADAPRFVSADEVLKVPPPVEIVRNTIFEKTINVVVAESGAGKTFVALDLAAALSEGNHWHGRKISEQGSTAYVSFEGDAFRLRVEALRQTGRDTSNLYIMPAAEPISPVVDRLRGEAPSRGEAIVGEALTRLGADLRAAGKPPVRLLVIDTVRASMSGSEDSSENVSAYVRVVRRLLSLCPDAGALITHHAGWQDGELKRKRERGSSAFRGNVEGTFYVEAEPIDDGGARLTWKTLKLRDAEKPAPLRLVRRRVELAGLVDSSGFPLTSCVIEANTATGEDMERERVEAVEARDRDTDRKLLTVIGQHECSSIARLRAYAGLGQAATVDALGRLLRAGLVTPPQRQREPYRLTPAGVEALA